MQDGYEPIEVIPAAKRTLTALRKLGYDFNSSVGDIVDNSIMAKAKVIEIDFLRKKGHFSLTITDDGKGMSPEQLKKAMRHGAELGYGSDSLGKFGMGLKTASLSQCRRLQVFSNAAGTPSGLSSCVWDLSHVENTDKWEILSLSRERLDSDKSAQILRNKIGTIVRWEDVDLLDRELASFSREGCADNWVGDVVGQLKVYLRMTFGRFIDGTAKKGKMEFRFNGEKLKSWDPFCVAEKETRKLESKKFVPLPKEFPGAAIEITPYVLPEKEGRNGFSSEVAWKAAKGLLHWNDSQGLYIYRNDRLIRYGGWHRIRGKSEHTKYVRVQVDVDDALDEIFELDVQKHQLKLPQSVRDFIEGNTTEACRIAKIRSEKRRTPGTSVNRGSNKAGQEVFPDAMKAHGIETTNIRPGAVQVTNPRGKNLYRTTRKGLEEDTWVEPGVVGDGRLWELIPQHGNKFKVVVNKNHPFYSKVYNTGNPALIRYIDCIISSVAYTELKAGNPKNREIFMEIRDTISEMLEKMSSADGFQRVPRISEKGA